MTHSNDHLGRVQGLDSDLRFFFSGGNEIRCFADFRGEGRNAAGLPGGCFHFAHTVVRPPLPPPGGVSLSSSHGANRALSCPAAGSQGWVVMGAGK